MKRPDVDPVLEPYFEKARAHPALDVEAERRIEASLQRALSRRFGRGAALRRAVWIAVLGGGSLVFAAVGGRALVRALSPDAVTRPVGSPTPKVVQGPIADSKPSGLGAEAKALSPALRALQDRAPKEALTLLEGYVRDFPNGQLRNEALVARVDAAMATGDHPLALGALAALHDQLGLLPRGPELLLLEGILADERGDEARAEQSLQAVLRLPGTSLAQRQEAEAKLHIIHTR